MNDFAYPLIIAHSGAERGPLIKMSWGTAGLLHLWQTPSMPHQPRGRPGGIGFKESGRSGCCHSAMTVTASTWRLQSNLLSGGRHGWKRGGVSINCQMEQPLSIKLKRAALCTYGIVTQEKRNTDRRKEKRGRAARYDKLRKRSESKGLRLILAVMQQLSVCVRGWWQSVYALYEQKRNNRCSQITLSQEANPLDQGKVILLRDDCAP